MISGILCILAGESLFFGSIGIGIEFVVFLVLNLIYIPLVEEKGLKRRFGNEYEEYKRNIPRWVPRKTPWTRVEDEF